MKRKKLIQSVLTKSLSTALVTTILVGGTALPVQATEVPDTNTEIENVMLYRQTSLAPSASNQGFKINFHSLEPLGIHLVEATEIEVLITGEDVTGKGQIYIHDEENIKSVATVPVGQKTKIKMPSKGQIFLDVKDIQYTVDKDTDFDFNVAITLDETSYKDTPTFDIREEKIADDVILDPEVFLEQIKANPDTGMLMISDNVRMYMPVNGYVPEAFDPAEVLEKHETTIREFNEFSGLDVNDPDPRHRPRKHFVLVSARNKQAGFMSAGNQMLDTHPKNSIQYFNPRWGMYHEYGHLYEQEWSYVEIWNNMFSKHMAEQTFGFTFIWGDDRPGYEAAKIKPYFDRYEANEIIYKDFDYKDGLYFFVGLEETLGEDFVAKMEKYWRENPSKLRKAEYVAYAVADIYGINIIPYLDLYGITIIDEDVYNQVIDMTTSSFIYTPDNPAFEVYSNKSVPVTPKSVYEGTNSVVSGMANPNSVITIRVGESSYETVADDKGKFSYTIPETITMHTAVSITSTELGKKPSKALSIEVKTPLSDNKIILQGYLSNPRTVIGLHPVKQVFDVRTITKLQANYQFKGEYFAVEHYKANGELVKAVSVDAQESAEKIEKALHGQAFEYGDYIKIRHQEPYRTVIKGEVIGAPDLSVQEQGCQAIDLKTSIFVITPNGLELQSEKEAAKVGIQGPAEVKAGETFEAVIGLSNVADVYAQDITITYDPAVFDFEAVKGILPTQVIEKLVQEGQVRILLSTEGGITGAQNIMSLTFVAKDTEVTSQMSTIQITTGQLGSVSPEGASTTIPAETSALEVNVKGESKPTSPDINEDNIVDVADLALVAYYYQAKAGDDNWLEAAKADVVKDGIIDIKDLAIVAQKMLEE